jgi:hypothetical protein
VGSGVDVAVLSEEMHEHVYTLIDSQRGGDVVNVLLEMHILEDEQSMLKRSINSCITGTPTSEAGGMSVGEAGSKEGSPERLFFASPGSGAESYSVDAKLGARDGSFSPASAETKGIPSSFSGTATAESKGKEGGLHGGPLGVSLSSPSPQEEDEHQRYLNSLKGSHKEKLDALKEMMRDQRARSLQRLEEKLMRRRIVRQTSEAKGTYDGQDDAQASLEAAEKEVENEIIKTERKFDSMEEAMLSGYKKRCLYEVKLTKEKRRALTKEDEEEAMRAAAEALKKRYERDSKSLLETLEAERIRQRNRLMKNIKRRKLGAETNKQIRALEEEEKKELAALEYSFDAQETGALQEPQERVLFMLSSIYKDPTSFTEDAPKARAFADSDEEDEDDYLNDSESNKKAREERNEKWVESVEELSKTYCEAGSHLQSKLRAARRASGMHDAVFELDESGEAAENEGSFSHVTAHMMRVISEAYSNHARKILASDDGDEICMTRKKGVNFDNIKAEILEEFERSRDKYESSLAAAKLGSKARLERRRKIGPGKGTELDDPDGPLEPIGSPSKVPNFGVTRVQAAFEEVIDEFLDDPLEVRQEQPERISIDQMRALSPQKSSSSGGVNSSVEPPSSPLKDNLSRSPLSSIGGAYAESSGDRYAAREQDELKRNRIRAADEIARDELLRGLEAQMVLKKKALEDRLRKKNQQSSSVRVAGHESAADTSSEQADINELQRAFRSVQSLVKV